MPRRKKDYYIEKRPLQDNENDYPVNDDWKKDNKWIHAVTKQHITFQAGWCIDFRLPINNPGYSFVIKYGNKIMRYYTPEPSTIEPSVTVPSGKYAYMVLSYICTQLHLRGFEHPFIYFGKSKEIAEKIGIKNANGKQIRRIKDVIKGFSKLSLERIEKKDGVRNVITRFCEAAALSDDEEALNQEKEYFTVLKISPEMMTYMKTQHIVGYDLTRFQNLEEDDDIPIFFWLTRSYYLLRKAYERNEKEKEKSFDWQYLMQMSGDKNDTTDRAQWIHNFKVKLNRIKDVFGEFNYRYDDNHLTLELSALQVPETSETVQDSNSISYYPVPKEEVIQNELFQLMPEMLGLSVMDQA